ncbi:receptor expression-enhancing protein 4 isoform X1 [Lemur catta]|uniref:receptor expression-enhancing protein 4 isoform X1 n=1 Tax=Lemur catta TaxID=9447 RepID=UPI001E26DCA9|nr:receptor expression-enhancing protein 4 isoform X1 [Lemur catta]
MWHMQSAVRKKRIGPVRVGVEGGQATRVPVQDLVGEAMGLGTVLPGGGGIRQCRGTGSRESPGWARRTWELAGSVLISAPQVRWMMYWIVFALFMAAEVITDIFISWFPFYYEIKMAFVLWLLSPYTKGASLLYRKFVHPSLSRHEKEIDTYIVQAKERSYETMLSFGKRGLNIAASAAVQAATKSQGALAGRLRSFSMQDLRSIPDAPAPAYQDPLYLEDQVPHRRPPIGYRAGGLQDSDTEDECWSDTEAAPRPPARPREKPLSRSQSLRVVKRKPPVREGTSRSLKVRTRKKTVPSDMDS